MNDRQIFWDNFKGILIFLVVFGHFLYQYAIKCNGTLADDIFVIIYLFHMPAFIFASGYMSKSERSQSKKSLLKLLLYYLVFNTGMMLFLNVFKGTQVNLLTPYNSYWYLLSLIAWRATIKDLSKVKGILPISIIIAILIGFWPEFSNVLSIRRTIAFFPFFLLGYTYEKEKLTEMLEKKNLKKTLIYLGVLVTAVIGLFAFVNMKNISLNMLLMGSYKTPIDALYRILIFVIAIIMTILVLLVTPNKKIPLISNIGRNSLLIYLVHRFITLVTAQLIPYENYSWLYIIYALILTIVTVYILGINALNYKVGELFNKTTEKIMDPENKTGTYIKYGIVLMFILFLLIRPINIIRSNAAELKEETNKREEKLPEESKLEVEKVTNPIDNSIVISYVGDLILLKDQITSAYNEKTKTYNFDKMFEYAKPYFESSDYTIGVYEGPSAGGEYSTSNYNDGLKLYLNFPDEFASAVKNSGIDLVSTANNHLLDKGKEGALRTLDVLDNVGLEHTGSYRNQKEKDELLIVDIEGIKVAVLSYTNFVNYYSQDKIEKEMSYITSLIPNKKSKLYDELKKEIKADFDVAKKSGADLILVMPHMGTQFTHKTNDFQKEWNKIFASYGADIILGDHSHAVQPIEYIGNTLVVNCPGNFANSYIKNDGDATSMVQIYIDKTTKKVVTSSIIPMYTHEVEKGYFRALPIYDIITNETLKEELEQSHVERVLEVQKIVTKTMLDEEIGVDNLQERYFILNNNFYKNKTPFITSNIEYKNNKLYNLISNSKSVTFIGDSITHGTKNGGYGWYEPLMNNFKEIKVNNISKGSYTTKLVIEKFEDDIKKSKSDLYIISIGTNDIRYRYEKTCSMNEEEYIENIDKIIEFIKESNQNAKIVLLSPWTTQEADKVSKISHEEKEILIDSYSKSLEKYAKDNKYTYINQNEYLREYFKVNNHKTYLTDAIHPNSTIGIELYSKAVLLSSK